MPRAAQLSTPKIKRERLPPFPLKRNVFNNDIRTMCYFLALFRRTFLFAFALTLFFALALPFFTLALALLGFALVLAFFFVLALGIFPLLCEG
jgi:hypothetical protein